MNYEEMSDFEINKSVLMLQAKLNDEVVTDIKHHPLSKKLKCFSSFVLFKVNGDISVKLDYCNNASHAWSIIDSNNIDIVAKRGHMKTGAAQSGCYYVSNKNKLRAAMIAYLKMNEE